MCEYSPEIQLINAYYDIYKYIKGRDTHEHFMQVQGRQPTLIQASIVGYMTRTYSDNFMVALRFPFEIYK